ncbi:BrnT family toxin [Bartonella sp. ML70XJBT]|uniref:BrnT family toxin n=1 Tax=Bartonella sp. ML70XJBT TaxID=3019096 RepID=UPI002361F870|nr:BrnT family toxin [Bartonella sp. ML70XJBT]
MTINIKIHGINWDEGNWPKCAKHGVSKKEIEYLFTEPGNLVIKNDPNVKEKRFRTIGRSYNERYIFLAFTLRTTKNELFARPISARYMHQKEIDFYENL